MTKDGRESGRGRWGRWAGIYQYNFVVDGVRILDPGINLKNGRAIDASVVEVPGTRLARRAAAGATVR